jgi:membrane protease subunit HflK
VTVRRIYLETMEEILKRGNMTLVDDRLQGIVPNLPLGEGPAARRPASRLATTGRACQPSSRRPANAPRVGAAR